MLKNARLVPFGDNLTDFMPNSEIAVTQHDAQIITEREFYICTWR